MRWFGVIPPSKPKEDLLLEIRRYREVIRTQKREIWALEEMLKEKLK